MDLSDSATRTQAFTCGSSKSVKVQVSHPQAVQHLAQQPMLDLTFSNLQQDSNEPLSLTQNGTQVCKLPGSSLTSKSGSMERSSEGRSRPRTKADLFAKVMQSQLAQLLSSQQVSVNWSVVQGAGRVNFNITLSGSLAYQITGSLSKENSSPEDFPVGNRGQKETLSSFKAPVYTINKQLITCVYYMLGKGNKMKKTQDAVQLVEQTPHTPVFALGSFVPDEQNASMDKGTPRGKRREVVINEEHLRRSKRMASVNKGHKAENSKITCRPMTRSQAKNKKVAPRPAPNVDKLTGFDNMTVTFPDLNAIDKAASSGLSYPVISIDELQRVAMTQCGIPPSEVTAEKLLAPQEDMEIRGALSEDVSHG